MEVTEEMRSEIASVLETVAKDGLEGSRDLDVAIDAIIAVFESNKSPAGSGGESNNTGPNK